MNTEFKILWFEDERTWYTVEERRIRSVLKEHCLTASISRKTDDRFSIDKIRDNAYDLILMDYRLAQGANGAEIAIAIRNQNILTDILFYSSQEDQMYDELKNRVPDIDGIYLAKRDQAAFTEKVSRLIDKIVRRSEDLVNLRGFVLDNSSDFEIQIAELLAHSWSIFSDTEKQTITDALIVLLENSLHWKSKLVEETKSNRHPFMTAILSPRTLSATDKVELFDQVANILYSSYGLNESPDISEENKKRLACFKQYYTDNLTVYRNQLGHARIGDKYIKIKGTEIEINQNLHRSLRTTINDIHELLESVNIYLQKLG